MTNRLLDLLPRVSWKKTGVGPKSGSNDLRANQRIDSFFSVANIVLSRVLEKEKDSPDQPTDSRMKAVKTGERETF
jgi:hypothetical protein